MESQSRTGESSVGLRESTSPAVLSLGSVNADFQTRVTRSIEGATSSGTHLARRSGGKAANVAFLAHRLGVPARLLGCVGDDDLREQALKPLRNSGLDVSGVRIARGHATAVSMIAVAPDGSKSIILANNANDDGWSAAERQAVTEEVRAAPAGSVLVADYEIPPDIVAAAIEAAAEKGLAIILDPAFPERVDSRIAAAATAITPDASEARALTGIDATNLAGAVGAARKLAAWGLPVVCLKLANGGTLLAHSGSLTVVPPLPFERIDSTGAGDAFAGALAVAMLERRPVLEAVALATAAAHISITRYGSQESYPTRDELETLLPKLIRNAYAIESL